MPAALKKKRVKLQSEKLTPVGFMCTNRILSSNCIRKQFKEGKSFTSMKTMLQPSIIILVTEENDLPKNEKEATGYMETNSCWISHYAECDSEGMQFVNKRKPN